MSVVIPLTFTWKIAQTGEVEDVLALSRFPVEERLQRKVKNNSISGLINHPQQKLRSRSYDNDPGESIDSEQWIPDSSSPEKDDDHTRFICGGVLTIHYNPDSLSFACGKMKEVSIIVKI